jgi:hypothetical protein
MLPTLASFANLLKGVIERAFELLKLGAKVKWYTTRFFSYHWIKRCIAT